MASKDITTRGPAVLGISVTVFVCSTAFVVLRMISRGWIVRRMGWDDYTMAAAWLLAFGTTFSICYGTHVGLGRHEKDVPDAWDRALKKSEYAFSVLYNPSLMATKTSILIFYLTLSKTQKIFKRATIATMAVVNVGGLALTFLNIIQCSPFSAVFETPVPSNAKCTDIITLYLSSAPLNIITDLAMLFLPMPILTSMRLPKKQKTIIVITFSFGVFVAVVDVVRIAYLQSAAKTHLEDIQYHRSSGSTRDDADDFSWYASLSFMWSAIEINVGIMCACVPALKPLVSRFVPSWIRDHTFAEKSRTNGSIGSIGNSDPVRMSQGLDTANLGQQRDFAQVSPPANPAPAAQTDSNAPMDMMDFLTTPDMNDMSAVQQTNTYVTQATQGTSLSNQRDTPFFDFVNIKTKKNITIMTNKESLFPNLMVTVLFFIWGFAYGLLDSLNAQFQVVVHMTNAQQIGIHSAYFCGYIFAPLTFGRLVFRHWGFKACYTVGLVIYACGTLVFWPSAVLTSFPAFLISNFIVGLGLSTLEVSANPFITLCGPPEWSEVRLNISQAIQAIGSVLSPLLAKKVLFKSTNSSLIDVQWTYLGISFFTIVLAVVYFYVPLPEATDDELEELSIRLTTSSDSSFGNVKVIWITLGLGIFSQFCYVGAQEAVSTSFGQYLAAVHPSLNSVSYLAVGHTAFAVSRFLAALAGILVKPRYLLLFFYAGSIAFAAAAMNGHGAQPTAIVMILYFFEGPIFSLIFAQAIRGLGKHTKDASAFLTAAIGGGGVLPPIFYGAQSARNVQYAYCVVVAALAFGALMPLWLNAVLQAKQICDPVIEGQARAPDEEDAAGTAGRKSSWGSLSDRVKRRWRKDKDGGSVEHREREELAE